MNSIAMVENIGKVNLANVCKCDKVQARPVTNGVEIVGIDDEYEALVMTAKVKLSAIRCTSQESKDRLYAQFESVDLSTSLLVLDSRDITYLGEPTAVSNKGFLRVVSPLIQQAIEYYPTYKKWVNYLRTAVLSVQEVPVSTLQVHPLTCRVDTPILDVRDGVKKPLVIGTSGTIYCGTIRYLSAQHYKLKTVPAIVIDDSRLTEELLLELLVSGSPLNRYISK